MQSNKEGTCATLVYVLTQTLKLLHPFIPFVTEKIYLELPNHDESIMISNWPEKTEMYEDAEYIDEVMNVIKTIRNARAEKKVPDNKKINCEIVLKNNKEIYSECVKYISKLALTNDINVLNSDGELKDNSVVLNFNDMIVNLPLDGMVDLTQEKERVEKEIARLKSEIERSEKMLANEGFVAKAPAKLIDAEKEKLEKNKALLADLTK